MDITQLLNVDKFQQVYEDHPGRPEVACGYIQGQINMAREMSLIDKNQYYELWSLSDDLWDANKYDSPAYDI